ncbi:hypothetical protein B0H17DRAFT_1214759 [Mycena rosella]|uniref:Uncharacterized protein n=1 Tax=Mycena rosella TaxID=1033263 RepID=A0AAD7G043_MYCRO|nr:hypothetical protein B0H17DRAFT_1214759 [Mycena rosella]
MLKPLLLCAAIALGAVQVVAKGLPCTRGLPYAACCSVRNPKTQKANCKIPRNPLVGCIGLVDACCDGPVVRGKSRNCAPARPAEFAGFKGVCPAGKKYQKCCNFSRDGSVRALILLRAEDTIYVVQGPKCTDPDPSSGSCKGRKQESEACCSLNKKKFTYVCSRASAAGSAPAPVMNGSPEPVDMPDEPSDPSGDCDADVGAMLS